MNDADRHDMIVAEVDGVIARFVVPGIPRSATTRLRQGLAWHRLALLEGACLCGGKRPSLSKEQQLQLLEPGARLRLSDIEHRGSCPTLFDEVVRYLAGEPWRSSPW